jgi:predicted RNA-binding Zn ribbon-like protein
MDDEAPVVSPVEAARRAPGRLELVRAFINTLDLDPDEETLISPEALARWLRERELIGATDVLTAADLERALSVREGLRDLLDARAHGHTSDSAIRSLELAAATAPLRVSFDENGATKLDPLASGLDRAVAELFAIIAEATIAGTWTRLKVCAAHNCRWAYYDRSKNHSRSWCNMAVCGNRAKARQYRERRRPAAPPPPG